MTEADFLYLTSKVFLAAWIGKHRMNGIYEHGGLLLEGADPKWVDTIYV